RRLFRTSVIPSFRQNASISTQPMAQSRVAYGPGSAKERARAFIDTKEVGRTADFSTEAPPLDIGNLASLNRSGREPNLY
ncbi:MAG: hypothetical protein AAFV29_26705, partial [Myxococcota bacterium]